jgi:hypothetical protein
MRPRQLFKDLTRQQINYVVEGLSLLLDEKFDKGLAVTDLGGLWALKRAADARLVGLDVEPEPPEVENPANAMQNLPEAWKPHSV